MASADARNEARLAAKAAADKKAADKAAADKAATGFETTGNVFTDTLNKLRAERGIKAEDVNTSGQLDVYGVTEKRIDAAQAVAAKPIMSEEQKAGGGVVKWVGGINGEYQIIMPTMSPLIGSKAAGWEAGRNKVNGTPPVTSSTTKTIIATVVNSDGSSTVSYSDGTSTIIPKKVVSTVDTKGVVTGDASTGPTTNVEVLKAALKNLGFSSAIIDSSTSFLTSLLKEGLDYDNAIDVFLNNKDYTLKSGGKMESPFYTEYGYLNEGLVIPKTANELFNAVEGYKEVVDKYSLSKKYLDKESLKLYTKNNVTAKDLAERANIATLKSVNQDPAYVEALQKLGYIATAADLKDFFMDPKIGQEQLNINRTTGAFAAEAIRRAQSGIQFNSERFKAIAQTMVEKGVSETEASTLAAQGFENIAAQLGTTTKLSGIYENQRAATMGQVQSELEKEEFSGLESERRKRLKAQEEAAFQGSAGTTAGSLRGRNVLGLI